MECSFPGCEKAFTKKTNRQIYCSNPHEYICTNCKKTETIAVKTYLSNGDGLCRDCRKIAGQAKRNKSLAEKVLICRFDGCLNEFIGAGSRVLYCSDTHERKCSDCEEIFSTSSFSPKELCHLCSVKHGRAKAKKTNMERYGVDNPIKSSEIKEKAKETFLKKYGVDNPLASPDIQEKIKTTLQERYGVSSPAQNSEIKDKIKRTNIERYGVENPAQAAEVKRKIATTNKGRYGHPAPLNHNPELIAKTKATKLARYGSSNHMDSAAVRELINKTNMERYGSPWVLGSAWMLETSVKSNLERRGVEYPTQDPKVREKVIKTVMERYGVTNVSQSEVVKSKIQSTTTVNLNNGLTKNKGKVSKVNLRFRELLLQEFPAHADSIRLEYPLGGKQFDLSIGELLIEINPTVSHNSERSFHCFRSGCEKDCLVHKPLTGDYHYKKAKIALAHDRSLIQVYDWDSQEKIIRLIAGKIEGGWRKISARKLELAAITQTAANRFFAKEHIQGGAKGQTHCYGLYENGELLAAASFGAARFNSPYQWEFIRYAVKRGVIIHGAAAILFRRFLTDVKPKSIVSYVDFDHSTKKNSFLSSLGFEESRKTGPSLSWSKGLKRIYNNSLVAQGADRLIGTNYGPPEKSGLNNRAIMLLEGWLPVETSGNRVFVYGD